MRGLFIFLFLAISISFSASRRVIAGVSPEYRDFYRPAKDFRCHKSRIQIPFARVNDDYCDCSDGSDEPGTSACAPLGRFYCQNKGYIGGFIPSSFVNDGICDCCDGEEETKIRCENSCRKKWELLREVKQKELQLHLQGCEFKEKLINSATLALEEKKKNLSLLQLQADHPYDFEDAIEPPEDPQKKMNENKKILSMDFGKHKEYYHLFGSTFEFHLEQYTYKLFPFDLAKQDDTLLGVWGGWKGDYTKMKYTGGDKCWNGPTRELTVFLNCGHKEEITAVNETSKCIYEMQLSTPGACDREHALSLANFIQERDIIL